MRVSQRLDYTLRSMIALAALEPGRWIAGGELADRLGMPRRFVEQQLTAMSKRGLVRCHRGAGGGCSLARPAEAISLGQVVRAVQGTVLDVPHASGSAASEVWGRVADGLAASMDAVSLASLAARQRELDEMSDLIYHI